MNNNNKDDPIMTTIIASKKKQKKPTPNDHDQGNDEKVQEEGVAVIQVAMDENQEGSVTVRRVVPSSVLDSSHHHNNNNNNNNHHQQEKNANANNEKASLGRLHRVVANSSSSGPATTKGDNITASRSRQPATNGNTTAPAVDNVSNSSHDPNNSHNHKLGQLHVVVNHNNNNNNQDGWEESTNYTGNTTTNTNGSTTTTSSSRVGSSAQSTATSQPGAVFVAGPGIDASRDDATVMIGLHPTDIGTNNSNEHNNEDLLREMEEQVLQESEEEENLVNARPVTGSSVFDLVGRATPVRPSMVQPEQANNRKDTSKLSASQKMAMAALGICALIGIIVGIVVFVSQQTHDNNDSNDSPSSSSNELDDSVLVTTGNATTNNTSLVLDLPLTLPNYTLETIQNDVLGVSPPYKAYQWIQQDPQLQFYQNNTPRLLQRYAAALFYYATGGPTWENQGGGVITMEVDAISSVQKYSFNGTASTVVGPAVPDNNNSSSNANDPIINSNLKEVNITSEPWLSYGTHECSWFNTATKASKPFCDTHGFFLNLDVSKNNLTGTIPQEIHLLSTLKTLKLGWNELEGTLPTQLGLLTHLEELRVFRSTVRGFIPSELGLLSNSLEKISFISSQLSGPIPSEILDGTLRTLQDFQANRNQLQGSLPNDIGTNLPFLRMLRMTENLLTGTLPSSLGLCTDLLILDLEGNAISGTIPSELSQLVNMTYLEVQSNNMTGPIPSELGLLPVLEVLGVHDNPGISGTLPIDLVHLNDTLEELSVMGTAVTGQIPDGLCSVTEFDCSDTLCGCANCTCSY